MKRYLNFGFVALFLAAMVLNFTSCDTGTTYVYRYQDRPGIVTWHEEVDVIVVGSGIAGFFAAATLAEEGWNVLMLEQNGVMGAVTRAAGGHGQNAFNILGDLTSTAVFDGVTVGPFVTRERFERAYAWRQRGASQVLAWNESATRHPPHLVPPELAGAIFPTTLTYPPVFPNLNTASFLGLHIRPSWEFMNSLVPVAGTNGFSRTNAAHAWFDSTHPGVLRLWSRATRIHKDPLGTVIGVQYTRLSPNIATGIADIRAVTEVRNVRARHGVIMATGGAHQNPTLLAQFGDTPSPLGNSRGLQYNLAGGQPFMNLDGHGMQMVVDAGGAWQTHWYRGIFGPAPRAHPSLMSLPTYGPVFYTPGNRPIGNTSAASPIIAPAMSRSIVVDNSGQRFIGETLLGTGFSSVTAAASVQEWPLWMIISGSSHGAIEVGGLNLIDALAAAAASQAFGSNFHFPGVTRHSNVVRTAANPADLATVLGFSDPAGFAAMIGAYDAAVAAALLPAGTWTDPLGSYLSPQVANQVEIGKIPGAENANLARFNDGPWFAVMLMSSGSETMGGIQTNHLGQALDANGHVIGGGRLYAIGAMNNRDHWGEVYGGSINFKGAAGWIAAQHIMGGAQLRYE